MDDLQAMSHSVIPAPVQFEGGNGEFTFRSGTQIAYASDDVAPLVAAFAAELTRRTGLSSRPEAGAKQSREPLVRIELAFEDHLAGLPPAAGLWPIGEIPPDERHSVTIDADQIVVRAASPVGVARGLSTLLQLLATTKPNNPGEIRLPGARILDAPRYAWRGLSLDIAREYFTPDELRRVIDLLALYKLNVLHLHLTDDQSWRLPAGRSDDNPESDVAFYSAEELRALVAYAADRFVTVVPEVDTPGHVAALVQMRPELTSGRNEVQVEFPPGHIHQAVWLDPDLPATFAVMEQVMDGVVEIFSSPYIHIGGDEPLGMPDDVYARYVKRLRDLVRTIGKHPVGWQESARAGLGPDDVIQYWFADIAVPASLPPEFRARMDADLALSRRDLDTAAAESIPVIVSPLSHCYLDVPYAGASADADQAGRQNRLGLHLYAPMTVGESFDWEPAEALGDGRAAQVAGVEAAIWSETISDFDDLSFLLLPRLPGIAHRAWSDPQATRWADHRDRLARHGRLWAQDHLTYFRSPEIEWL